MAYEVQTIGQIIGAVIMLFVFYVVMKSFSNKDKTKHGKPIKTGLWVGGLIFGLVGFFFLFMIIVDAFIGDNFELGGFLLLLIMGLLPLIGGILMILMAMGKWESKLYSNKKT